MDKSLFKPLQRAWSDFRQNQRLQLALVVLLLLGVFEGGMRWSDHLSAQSRELSGLRDEVRTLRGQTYDEKRLKEILHESEKAGKEFDQRIWQVSSEVLGQARLKDWLLGLATATGLQSPQFALSTTKPLKGGDVEVSGDGVPAGGLAEFRGTLGFVFTPEKLEKVLAGIEGGQTLSVVEGLRVSRRERRVEIAVKVLMDIVPETPAGAGKTAEGKS